MYAVDLGGTNLRVMYVHLSEEKSKIVSTGASTRRGHGLDPTLNGEEAAGEMQQLRPDLLDR